MAATEKNAQRAKQQYMYVIEKRIELEIKK
jgi:hypothetical protein